MTQYGNKIEWIRQQIKIAYDLDIFVKEIKHDNYTHLVILKIPVYGFRVRVIHLEPEWVEWRNEYLRTFIESALVECLNTIQSVARSYANAIQKNCDCKFSVKALSLRSDDNIKESVVYSHIMNRFTEVI